MKKLELGNLKVNSLRKEIIADGRYEREKHVIKISNGKINKYFTYTTQVIQYINREKLLSDALWCIYQDYLVYERSINLKDFITEYGYEYKEGKKVYSKLEKSYERFNELVDAETLELLEKVYEEY